MEFLLWTGLVMMMPYRCTSSDHIPPSRPLVANTMEFDGLVNQLRNQNDQLLALNQVLLTKNQQMELLLRQYMHQHQVLTQQVAVLSADNTMLRQLTLEYGRTIELTRPLLQDLNQNILAAKSRNQTQAFIHPPHNSSVKPRKNKKQPEPDLRKTEPCRHFNTFNGCRFGNKCAFLHNNSTSGRL